MSYRIKKGSKILKGGRAIASLNIEKELDEKTIAELIKNKTLIKVSISKKEKGEKENGKIKEN